MSNVQENGVPQGSVLSVPLFAIAINSVVRAIGPHVSTSFYVNDVAISYASKSMDTRTQTPTHDQPPLTLGVAKWFLFLCAKTQCVYFLRFRGVHPPPVLCMNNHALPVVPSAKFLGLVLDSRLLGTSPAATARFLRAFFKHLTCFVRGFLGRGPNCHVTFVSFPSPFEARLWFFYIWIRNTRKTPYFRSSSPCGYSSRNWSIQH
jgi:hypothetical protein